MQTAQPLDRLNVAERPERFSCGCSITGTTSTARSSAATRADRSGSGPTCPPRSIRATPTTRAPTRRSASTAPSSTTSTPTPHPLGRVPREGGGARGRVAAVRRAHVPLGELRGAGAARRTDHRRSARHGRGSPGGRRRSTRSTSSIPDFGGFFVKANSEGQPGPKDYGRNHAEGANVLADALAPHGGDVIWRAFIYDEDVDPDRAKRAYIEFTKLDGQFKPNVLVQVKNGAIDFHAARAVPSAVRRARRRRRCSPRSRRRRSTSVRRSTSSISARCGRSSSRGHLREGHGHRRSARSSSGAIPTGHRHRLRRQSGARSRTGAAIISRSRTGTRRDGWRGTRISRRGRSPTSGRA